MTITKCDRCGKELQSHYEVTSTDGWTAELCMPCEKAVEAEAHRWQIKQKAEEIAKHCAGTIEFVNDIQVAE